MTSALLQELAWLFDIEAASVVAKLRPTEAELAESDRLCAIADELGALAHKQKSLENRRRTIADRRAKRYIGGSPDGVSGAREDKC